MTTHTPPPYVRTDVGQVIKFGIRWYVWFWALMWIPGIVIGLGVAISR